MLHVQGLYNGLQKHDKVCSASSALFDDGWSTCFHDSSETWTSPSMPPRSTNAPKLTTDDTTPLRTSPGFRLVRNSSRCSRWVSSRYARRDKHDVVAVLVELDDLALEHTSDERVQVAHTAQVDERRGKEAAQTDVDDETALDDLDDRTGDDLFVLLLLLDRAPRAFVLRALLGKDQATVLVLLLEDERFDLFAERHDLVAGRRRCGSRAPCSG